MATRGKKGVSVGALNSHAEPLLRLYLKCLAGEPDLGETIWRLFVTRSVFWTWFLLVDSGDLFSKVELVCRIGLVTSTFNNFVLFVSSFRNSFIFNNLSAFRMA